MEIFTFLIVFSIFCCLFVVVNRKIMLDKHKDLKITYEQKVEKQSEYKIIGTWRKQGNLKLWAFDVNTKSVYAIDITSETVFDPFSEKSSSKFKAHIDRSHPLLWSLTKENAERKFKKHGYIAENG